MKTNGEAIYGTAASPFEKLDWGRCTQKTLPGGQADSTCTSSTGRRMVLARLGRGCELTGQRALAITAGERQTRSPSPTARAPDAIASVIELDIEGSVKV